MKIAHIDAEEDIRMLVELQLASLGGHDVITCGSPEEALARLPVERPDIVLLEVFLPGMSGLELRDRLAGMAALEETVFIFLTTQASGAAGAELENVAPVIPKPFDPGRLPFQVRAMAGPALRKAGRRRDVPARRRIAA